MATIRRIDELNPIDGADKIGVALNSSGSPVYPEGLNQKHFGVEE